MLKKLMEARAKLGQQIRAMAELQGKEERAFTAEEQANWEKLNADFDVRTARIDTLKRSDEIQVQLEEHQGNEDREHRDNAGTGPGREDRRGDSIPGHEVQGLALQGWMRYGSHLGIEQRHRDAAELCGVDFTSSELHMQLPVLPVRSIAEAYRQIDRAAEFRAPQSGVTGAGGGFLIPSTLLARFELAKLQFGGVLQVAEILRTSTGEELSWPSSDDTSNSGEQIGENTAVSEQAAAFALTKWRSYAFSSKMIKVPFSLLRDSAVNLEAVLGSMLGERIGRIMNEKFTTGTGANTPYGIVERATTGKTTASATAITFSEIFDLEHSVDPAYRQGRSVGFMFNDAIALYLRKLLDNDGRPLWQPDLTGGVADRLSGRPVTYNQDMSSTVTASDKTILFGDLSYYKVREVGQLRLRRLVERYAEYDQIAFIAFQSGDGNLLDAGQHPVKLMVQHA